MVFSELVKSYYNSWFRFHPESAVAVGVSGYEDILKPYSDDDIGALIALNKSLLSSLQELNTNSLSEDEKIDFNILYSAASGELHELLERDWRYRNPIEFLPLNAIHQLLMRPIDNLHAAVKHRLQAIPSHLRGAKILLQQQPELIPPVWLQSAIDQASAGVGFILNLEQHPVVLKHFSKPERLHEIAEQASHALNDFAVFMQRELQPLAAGDFACGKTTYERLLKESHFIPLTTEQLYNFGSDLFEQTQAQLNQLLEGASVQQTLDKIKADTPPRKKLLEYYRQSMQKALAFISEKDLLTVPQSQRLSVIETPDFLRHEIPFAAYDEPTRTDPQQHGYYYVTLPEQAAGLAEHNKTSIDLTSVHEAYPGHHLQFSTANQIEAASSLVRVLNATSTFYEGWALYCEELMVEQAYLKKPEHKIIMLRDRLWRALRVMIDIDIHTRGMSIEQAAQRLCDELGFEYAQAKAELNWYSLAPTVPMSYATGWGLIKSVREILQQQTGFELKKFHDDLLSAGSVPLPLVFQSRFGDSVNTDVMNKLFPG
ncbi:MAG: DUF885 domain-containing protein [Gammaproteobacteria bacterium]|nr:DUF885 domain-containing protein [Gammaproteobacteria bacterium]